MSNKLLEPPNTARTRLVGLIAASAPCHLKTPSSEAANGAKSPPPRRRAQAGCLRTLAEPLDLQAIITRGFVVSRLRACLAGVRVITVSFSGAIL